ncbi:hypothetical protein V6N13_004119 [Hibiscus sabdariffa]|uniref:Uncharacterized protein n=1 Tax=Hibiscus sabdariffa TaxID=183260 RepID=A0ABR2RY23_9ROSI
MSTTSLCSSTRNSVDLLHNGAAGATEVHVESPMVDIPGSGGGSPLVSNMPLVSILNTTVVKTNGSRVYASSSVAAQTCLMLAIAQFTGS